MKTLTEHVPAAYEFRRFNQQLRAVQRMLDGQLLVSKDRCVDALLDLYNVAPAGLVRELVAELISGIRYTSTVRAQLLDDDLSVLSGCLGSEVGERVERG